VVAEGLRYELGGVVLWLFLGPEAVDKATHGGWVVLCPRFAVLGL
jgi:hypothetical protein